jgi:ABC-2 type transport system permease protein
MVIVFVPAGEDITVAITLVGAMWLTTLLLPLVSIVGAYLAVAGERESNTIRFLLSQPTARSAVVLGKFLSRGFALVAALSIALVVGSVIVLTQYADPDLAALGPFVVLSVLMVSAYVSVAVAISSAVASRARAIAATVGFYFVTVVLSVFPGASIENMLQQILGDVLGLSIADSMYAFIASVLSPAIAYMNALSSTFPADAPRTVPTYWASVGSVRRWPASSNDTKLFGCFAALKMRAAFSMPTVPSTGE